MFLACNLYKCWTNETFDSLQEQLGIHLLTDVWITTQHGKLTMEHIHIVLIVFCRQTILVSDVTCVFHIDSARKQKGQY